MSEDLANWKASKGRRRDLPRDDDLPAQELKALRTLRKEAKERGATLATAGKGGLPPSLVLHCLRRDEYRCKRCGGQQNLTMHHVGGLENPSPRLAKKGHSNDPNNIVTLDERCHDAVHEEDRARG